MRYLLTSFLICLCFSTNAQADPVTIGGTAEVTNFIAVFRWDTPGPQVSFTVLNTCSVELHSISFGVHGLSGDLLLPLAPGESRSFSLMVLQVPPGVSLFDSLTLRFQPVTGTPEPGSVLLLLTGGLALLARLRRGKTSAK